MIFRKKRRRRQGSTSIPRTNTERYGTSAQKSESVASKPEQRTQKKSVIYSISQVFRNLSISMTLTVYAIYLIYLIYSITHDIGIKILNIALALVTAAFMVVYLVLRLSGKKRGKELRQIKHYYKNFKLLARTTSAIIAIYALLTAIGSVSPLAIIIAFLGAVFLVFRIIVELILLFIRKKFQKIKANITAKRSDETEIDDVDEDNGEDKTAEQKPARRKRKRRIWEIGKKDEHLEDIVVPVDQCLLNDLDV